MVKINLLIGAPSGAGGSAPMNPGAINFGGISVPGAGPSQPRAPAAAGGRSQVDPYALREMLLASPHEIAFLKQNNPVLADALLSNDPGESLKVCSEIDADKSEKETCGIF